MLLMVEKGVRGGICHSINRYEKANNKYLKDYDKNKESSYLQYQDVNRLYGCPMSQKFPVNNFAWTKDTSQFNPDMHKIGPGEPKKYIFLGTILAQKMPERSGSMGSSILLLENL